MLRTLDGASPREGRLFLYGDDYQFTPYAGSAETSGEEERGRRTSQVHAARFRVPTLEEAETDLMYLQLPVRGDDYQLASYAGNAEAPGEGEQGGRTSRSYAAGFRAPTAMEAETV